MTTDKILATESRVTESPLCIQISESNPAKREILRDFGDSVFCLFLGFFIKNCLKPIKMMNLKQIF
jgi:hypothetical protein